MRAYDRDEHHDLDRRAPVIAGRYTLEREIGRGGMGAVWLGVDEVLDREVALKRIGTAPGTESSGLARAEREARLAAQLNHPHVVAVFNFVVDAETDARWLVMEYVEGSTLDQLVREHGRLSPDDAAKVLWQAADGLVAAHAAGIVHRDVKPSNILVERTGRAKITDFGIARIATDPSLTQTGMVTGSPAYLAPEVALGQRGDEAADVWSLGATLFTVLSGRPPYEMGDNVMSGLYRLVHDEPPRLDDAGWLAPLLEATLVKDPARRWSMVQVRDFLAGPAQGRRWRRHGSSGRRTTTEPEPTRETPAAPPRERRRLPVPALLGALALVLVVAVVLFLTLRDRDPAGGTAGATTAPSSSPSARSPRRAPPPARALHRRRPRSRGMESFIRDYVTAVATDPDTAWQMLTPKFQRESGGLDAYRKFWSGVGNPEILAISADPDNLVVSYRVRFDNFGTGKRPTVLDLEFDRGRYRIDGERTLG